MDNKMQSSVQMITPEIALEMLSSNDGNRPLRSSVVKRLANAIRRGEWRVSHQGIAIDASGRLLDGQHRLRAIVESGIACEIMVTRNVLRAAFRVMDQGARRSMADLAGIDKRVVEGCSLAATLLYGGGPTFSQIEPIISSRIGSTICDLVEFCGTSRRFYSSAPMKLTCAIISLRSAKDREYAFCTYRALAHLDFDAMSPAAKALVRQEQNGKVSAGGSNSRGDTIARALVTFDRERQSATRIQVSDTAPSDALRIVRDTIRAEIDNA